MEEWKTSTTFSVEEWRSGNVQSEQNFIAEETPVAFEYNGIAHAVMMATPSDLEDFALGFSLTEGIILNPSELYSCDVMVHCDGIKVELEIASERFWGLKEKRRNISGRTGCGLCGVETLEQATRTYEPVKSTASFSGEVLHAGFRQMENLQTLRQITGATHAAAWLLADGSIAFIVEDVGRHNALDKLIGALVRQKMDRTTGAAIVTSRASYEMVQKCASVGIGMLAAVSAPTALAIRIAKKTNMTLIGFTRSTSHVIYNRRQ